MQCHSPSLVSPVSSQCFSIHLPQPCSGCRPLPFDTVTSEDLDPIAEQKVPYRGECWLTVSEDTLGAGRGRGQNQKAGAFTGRRRERGAQDSQHSGRCGINRRISAGKSSMLWRTIWQSAVIRRGSAGEGVELMKWKWCEIGAGQRQVNGKA